MDRINGRITAEMTQKVCELGDIIARGGMSRDAAADILVEMGMNEASALMYLQVFHAMLGGGSFGRGMKVPDFRLVLNHIRNKYGFDAFRQAVLVFEDYAYRMESQNHLSPAEKLLLAELKKEVQKETGKVGLASRLFGERVGPKVGEPSSIEREFPKMGRTNRRITKEMTQKVCELGDIIARGGTSRGEAIEVLVNMGMNRDSAEMYLSAFKNMLEGTSFHCCMKPADFKFALNHIRENHGFPVFKCAVLLFDDNVKRRKSKGKKIGRAESRLLDEMKKEIERHE